MVDKRHEMVDAAAKHDQANALTTHDPIMRADATDDAAREVAGDLHYCVAATGGVGKGDEVTFVVLVGIVAEGRAEFSGRVRDGDYFARRGCTIDVHVEWRHEDRHPAKPLAGLVAWKFTFANIGDLTIGGGQDRIFGTRWEALGVAEKGANREGEYQHNRRQPQQPERE